MNYKIRPGIIMVKICDSHLLVAKRELWDRFSGVRPISKKYAVCWALMEGGRTSDEVIQSMSELFHKPYEEISQRFEKVFRNLAAEGYLVGV